METTSIAEFYGGDHRRLDALFMEFRRLKPKDPPKAKAVFEEFRSGLLRHIVWEEDILFPVFRSQAGPAAEGPISVMRQEHLEIEAALAAIHAKVRRGESETAVEEAVFLDIIRAHNLKEERVLYPAVDRVTDEAQRKAILRKMQSVESPPMPAS